MQRKLVFVYGILSYLVLLVLYLVQISLMTRKTFKHCLTRFVMHVEIRSMCV